MSAKAGFPLALVLTILGMSMARAGQPPTPLDQFAPSGQGGSPAISTEKQPLADMDMAPTPIAPAGADMPTGPGEPSGMPGTAGGEATPVAGHVSAELSSWMRYFRPECCSNIGGDGPIMEELYFRTGPSIVVSGNVLNTLLETGWTIEGGGRTLFYNPGLTAAWTVDLGLSYFYNQSHSSPNPIIQAPTSPAPTPTPVTLERLHRTFANLGLGREWYLSGAANNPGLAWRAGFDVDGRLGTAKADFREIRHRTDVIYGFLLAAHTDLEWTPTCCTYFVGFRVEFGETYSTILQTNNANFGEVNLLMNLGVRF